jgi:hypothetical protein
MPCLPTNKLLHDICWIFCTQRCILVEVLFTLKLKYTILYINERTVLECCIHLDGVATSTYFVEVCCIYDCFMERYSTSIHDSAQTIDWRSCWCKCSVRINNIDDGRWTMRSGSISRILSRTHHFALFFRVNGSQFPTHIEITMQVLFGWQRTTSTNYKWIQYWSAISFTGPHVTA